MVHLVRPQKGAEQLSLCTGLPGKNGRVIPGKWLKTPLAELDTLVFQLEARVKHTGKEGQDQMDPLGFEPRAFRMRSGCDTTTQWAREYKIVYINTLALWWNCEI